MLKYQSDISLEDESKSLYIKISIQLMQILRKRIY